MIGYEHCRDVTLSTNQIACTPPSELVLANNNTDLEDNTRVTVSLLFVCIGEVQCVTLTLVQFNSTLKT